MNTEIDKSIWVEIRDSRRRLLFRYNPATNIIEIKPKNTDVHCLVHLDDIRRKYGYIPAVLTETRGEVIIAISADIPAKTLVKNDETGL